MSLPLKSTSSAQTDHYITFHAGGLILIMEGQFISLDSPILLENGIIIMPDGTINFLDGSKKSMLEGETFCNF